MSHSNAVSRYLAHNLLALRLQRNMSQQKLSQRAGIPRSTITHMESGEGNPSLNNLCKLAGALSVGIEELLSRPRSDVTLVKRADVPALRRAAGKVTVHKLMPDKVRGIEIDRVIIEAHASLGGKPHIEGSKEYLMTLSGTMVVAIRGEDYTVEAGDVLAFPGDQKHGYRNPGGNTAEALSVVLPMPYTEARASAGGPSG